MKNFSMCLVTSVLIASSAMAASDWNTLRLDNRFDIDAPNYLLTAPGMREGLEVSLLDLCRSGNVVRSVSPITVCVREAFDYSQNPYRRKCMETTAVTPEMPIQGVESACVKTQYQPNSSGYHVPVCVKTEQRAVELPMTHKLKVTQYWQSKTYYARNIARRWVKTFEIPSCN